jgi:hypothetical protein
MRCVYDTEGNLYFPISCPNRLHSTRGLAIITNPLLQQLTFSPPKSHHPQIPKRLESVDCGGLAPGYGLETAGSLASEPCP